jgi:prepilin peptidase CpaA
MTDVVPPALLVGRHVLFACFLIAVCVWDARTRRIPNVLVLVILACGLASSLVAGPWPRSLLGALGGAAVGFAVWMPFYLLRMLGAGDVKFFAAASAWLGPGLALKASVWAGVFGGLLAAIWLLRDVGWVVTLARVMSARDQLRRGQLEPMPATRSRLPYGVAMAAGLGAAAWLPYMFH